MPRVAPTQADSWFVGSGWGSHRPSARATRPRPVTKGATIVDVVFYPDLTLEAP